MNGQIQNPQVNTDPCLFADPVDVELKSSLIAEMLNLVGFHIPTVIMIFDLILVSRLTFLGDC